MQAIDDIDRQAREGSVAAIIQILNEHFADSSIRTRAVLDQGILQLLCEAPTSEQLPQAEVVEQVRTVLESVSPRGITKVNISSRIVQEQQLLWLDEIKRNPGRLLWSELITLKRPNPIARAWQDMRSPRQRNPFLDDIPSRKKPSNNAGFWRGLIGGASLCLLLVLVGWAMKDWLGFEVGSNPAPTPTEPAPEAAPQPPPEQDPFVQAVRIAQQAVEDGQAADSAADWLDLAARWQRASDLMAEVPPEDERYSVAQERVALYQQYSDQALQQSDQANGEAQ